MCKIVKILTCEMRKQQPPITMEGRRLSDDSDFVLASRSLVVGGRESGIEKRRRFVLGRALCGVNDESRCQGEPEIQLPQMKPCSV